MDRSATELDRLIIQSAREANVLPVTSRCDSRCVFCSHRNNPPGVRVLATGVRPLEDVARTMAFLDAARAITIGESATPIVEGEPLSHPAFREIVSLLRRAFPRTPVEITTNGKRLTGDLVEMLRSLAPVALNISLNSASAHGRRLLMGDSAGDTERATAGVRLAGEAGIAFAGSLVAMPNLVGWDDIRATVEFLAAVGATAVRLIVPAFSAQADERRFPDKHTIAREVREFVDSLAGGLPCPLLMEPSHVTDLTPVVSGVRRSSPAYEAGLRRGDVVRTVDGRAPRCRVEAWNLLCASGCVAADVERAGASERMSWRNRPGVDPGVTMEYDFDPVRAERLGDVIRVCEGRALLLTSELAHPVVAAVLESLALPPDQAVAVPVANRTFGGSIGAAGLLTVEDFLVAYRERCALDLEASLVIVPIEAFDAAGVDLKGRHYADLQAAAGLPVALL